MLFESTYSMSQVFCERDHAYMLSSVCVTEKQCVCIQGQVSYSQGLIFVSKCSRRLFSHVQVGRSNTQTHNISLCDLHSPQWEYKHTNTDQAKHTQTYTHEELSFVLDLTSEKWSESVDGFRLKACRCLLHSIIKWPFKRRTYNCCKFGPMK